MYTRVVLEIFRFVNLSNYIQITKCVCVCVFETNIRFYQILADISASPKELRFQTLTRSQWPVWLAKDLWEKCDVRIWRLGGLLATEGVFCKTSRALKYFHNYYFIWVMRVWEDSCWSLAKGISKWSMLTYRIHGCSRSQRVVSTSKKDVMCWGRVMKVILALWYALWYLIFTTILWINPFCTWRNKAQRC